MAWYTLDNNNKPVPSTAIDASKWMHENLERKVVKQDYIGDIWVSTVFLGMDHNLPWVNKENPVLWETMIFGGDHDQYQERYTSYEDALEGHQTALNLVNKK